MFIGLALALFNLYNCKDVFATLKLNFWPVQVDDRTFLFSFFVYSNTNISFGKHHPEICTKKNKILVKFE